ncbi:hypothetical protein [Thermocrinis sp.]
MKWKKVVEKIKDIITGELKGGFKVFSVSLESKLSGFRLAIESIRICKFISIVYNQKIHLRRFKPC